MSGGKMSGGVSRYGLAAAGEQAVLAHLKACKRLRMQALVDAPIHQSPIHQSQKPFSPVDFDTIRQRLRLTPKRSRPSLPPSLPTPIHTPIQTPIQTLQTIQTPTRTISRPITPSRPKPRLATPLSKPTLSTPLSNPRGPRPETKSELQKVLDIMRKTNTPGSTPKSTPKSTLKSTPRSTLTLSRRLLTAESSPSPKRTTSTPRKGPATATAPTSPGAPPQFQMMCLLPYMHQITKRSRP